MKKIAVFVRPGAPITYGTSWVSRATAKPTEDLRSVIRTLIAVGYTNIRVYAPGHDKVIAELGGPGVTIRLYRMIDLVGPLVRTNNPIQTIGAFQAHFNFGVVWCNRDEARVHLLAYKANTARPDEPPTFTHCDEVAAGPDEAGQLLEIAESLVRAGVNNIAIFIPEDSELWRVLIKQTTRRLFINLAVFVTSGREAFEALLA